MNETFSHHRTLSWVPLPLGAPAREWTGLGCALGARTYDAPADNARSAVLRRRLACSRCPNASGAGQKSSGNPRRACGLGGKRRSAVRRVLPVTGVVKESLANPALVRCAVPLLLAPGYDCGIPSSTPRTRAPRRAHGDAHRILWRRTRSLCGPWALHTAPRAPRCVFRDHSLASLPRRSEDSERVAA